MKEEANFDGDKPGALPAGWVAGVTGSGSPSWAVTGDPKAPSPPNVLMQSGRGTFPWCVCKDVSKDSHITGAGAVGVWTKADSVTSFDDFKYGK